MNAQAAHYERAGDMIHRPAEKERAYRAAQNHMRPSDTGWWRDLMRLQRKIRVTKEVACE